MTYLHVGCSYRRAEEEERFNVGRVLVLNTPPAVRAWRLGARSGGAAAPKHTTITLTLSADQGRTLLHS